VRSRILGARSRALDLETSIPYERDMTRAAQTVRGAVRSRGRPREFDIDQALDGAIDVFRERGYHATTVPALAAAMNIASGSLYKAFGDKHAVFLAALDRDASERSAHRRRLAEAPKSARERLRDLLALYVDMSAGVEGLRGCLVVGGAIELAARDPEVDARVTQALQSIETLLADIIVQGLADGSIAASVDPQATARVLIGLVQGLRVLGRTRLSPSRAPCVLDVAMKLVA
jgi:TetR/AcrR family transcriptional repressor of nem operon